MGVGPSASRDDSQGSSNPVSATTESGSVSYVTLPSGPAPAARPPVPPDPPLPPFVDVGVAFSGGGIRSAAFCAGVLRGVNSLEAQLDTATVAPAPPPRRIFLSCVSGGGYTGSAYVDWKKHRFPQGWPRWQDNQHAYNFYEEFYQRIRANVGYLVSCRHIFVAMLDIAVLLAVLFTLMALVLLQLTAITIVVAHVLSTLAAWLLSCGDDIYRDGAGCENHEKWIPITICAVLAGISFANYVTVKICKMFKWHELHGLFYVLFIFVGSIFSIYVAAFTDQLYFVNSKSYNFVVISSFVLGYVVLQLRNRTDKALGVAFGLWAFIIGEFVAWRIYQDFGLFAISWLPYRRGVWNWLFFSSALVLFFLWLLLPLKNNLLYWYYRWRLQYAFYYQNPSSCCPTTELHEASPNPGESSGPIYVANLTANGWRPDEADQPYGLLALEANTPAEYYALREESDGRLVPGSWNGNRNRVCRHYSELDQRGPGYETVYLAEAMAVSGAAVANNFGRLDDHFSDYRLPQTLGGLSLGQHLPSLICIRDRPRFLGPLVVALCLQCIWTLLGIQGYLLVKSRVETVLLDLLLVCSPIFVFLCFIVIGAFYRNSELWRRFAIMVPFMQSIFLMLRIDFVSQRNPPQLYLSDGGHFENLGIIPLIRRRCSQIIIASGSEGKDNSGKEELIHALRQARLHCNCEFTDEMGGDVETALNEFYASTPAPPPIAPPNPPLAPGNNYHAHQTNTSNPHPSVFKFQVRYHDAAGVNTADVFFLRPRMDLIVNDRFLYSGCCCSCCARVCSRQSCEVCCPTNCSDSFSSWCLACCLRSSCCASTWGQNCYSIWCCFGYLLGCTFCRFPNMSTALQFLSPVQFEAYSLAGMIAWNEAIVKGAGFGVPNLNPLPAWNFAPVPPPPPVPPTPPVPMTHASLRHPFTAIPPTSRFWQPHHECALKDYCCPCLV